MSTLYEQEATSRSLPCSHIDYYKSPDERESTSQQRGLFALNTILTAPLWGLWTSLSYAWLFAPIFDLPSINAWQGLGLGLFVSIFRYKLGSRHVSAAELGYRAFEDWTAPILGIALFWLFAKLVLGTA